MAIQLKKAQRKRVKLKIGISAPSGGGKTASALILAYGLVKAEHPELSDDQVWERIALVDTENGSGELYSNGRIGQTDIGTYNVIELAPPFETSKCIESIHACKEAGMEVCIIDSTSAFWQGVGGLLEKQGNVAKRTNNSYTAWREVTPEYNRMIDAILQTDMHMICTVRSKTDYAQNKDEKGKTVIQKVGMAPVIRDGFEYELSLFLDLDTDHQAYVSKDRTGVLDGKYFVVTPDTGKQLVDWLDGAKPVDAKPEVLLEKADSPKTRTIDDVHKDIKDAIAKKMNDGFDRAKMVEVIKGVCGVANYQKISDPEVAEKILAAVQAA